MVRNTAAWAFSLLLLGSTAAWAQSTRPTAPPASPTTTSPVADYSDPKKTLATFLRASDEKSLRESLLITPQHSREIDAFLGVMISQLNLQKAAQAQFGTAAAKYFSQATDDLVRRRLQALQAAQVTLRGTDGATIELPADPEVRQRATTMELKKVDGAWKIDAAAMFGVAGATPEVMASRLKLANALQAVSDQMIKDLPKFLSAGDAFQEYWNRSKAAEAQLSGRTPSTRP
jgi:hypothetical protein